MNHSWILLVPILLPILCGALIAFLRMEERKKRESLVLFCVLLNSLVMWAIIIVNRELSPLLTLASFSENMTITLRLDGLGTVFAGMVSLLWPIASVYAFEYMKHEGMEVKFFCFYTMTYGVTLGIALAANLLTMYLFYELLTLVTLPLVMHSLSEKARAAGKKYVIYSIGGASLTFIGMVFLYRFAGNTDFVMGGVLSGLTLSPQLQQTMLLIFVLTFMGFGVKAALFPLHGWLPAAGVAPTTVTALLHAVAVVKAGAFAAMRATYYLFGADFVRGTWAQDIVLLLAGITILYGSAMALREQHIKRRLAYSTVANLSYILFGVALMTPMGLYAALTQMVAHAFIKITLFYCAGAIIYKAHYEYIEQLTGLGRKMPVVMGCFTLASLALMGVPLLPGFLGKSSLLTAGLALGTPMAYFGVAALLISSLLTAIYLMGIVIPAFFPEKGFADPSPKRDPNRLMTGPLVLLCVICLLLGLLPAGVLRVFSDIASGLI